MSPVTNKRVLFNEHPTGTKISFTFRLLATLVLMLLFGTTSPGYPEPGKTVVLDQSQTIDIDKEPLNGGVLVKLLVLSVDPYLRGMMDKESSYGVSNCHRCSR